jgi:hypothetical protein
MEHEKNDIQSPKPNIENIQYPIYVRNGNYHDKPTLFYERRVDGKRQNIILYIQSDDIKAEYKLLQKKVLLKYEYQLPDLE